ncbi:hypothetical protein BLNAU_15037 [Blattamonas nauphoetae]|uniref:Uncharacterized protein n=1 Tax=Blattamonas nauphoetae TaxID=2049346 RepID=A0ABQ9XBW3_9EUKA|nr:hypothetical protein BLNAU_15037 [Blattamonas nauphoetae]
MSEDTSSPQYTDLVSRYDELTQAIHGYELQNDRITQDKVETVAFLQNRLKEINAAIDILDEEIKRYEQVQDKPENPELEKFTTSIAALQTQIAEKELTIREQARNIRRFLRISKENATLTEEVEKAREAYAELKHENDEEIERLKVAHMEEENTLAEQIRDQIRTVEENSMQDAKNKLNTVSRELITDNADLHVELLRLNQICSELTKENVALSSSLQAAVRTCSIEDSNDQVYRKLNDKTTKDIDDLHLRISDLQQSIEDIKARNLIKHRSYLHKIESKVNVERKECETLRHIHQLKHAESKVLKSVAQEILDEHHAAKQFVVDTLAIISHKIELDRLQVLAEEQQKAVHREELSRVQRAPRSETPPLLSHTSSRPTTTPNQSIDTTLMSLPLGEQEELSPPTHTRTLPSDHPRLPSLDHTSKSQTLSPAIPDRSDLVYHRFRKPAVPKNRQQSTPSPLRTVKHIERGLAVTTDEFLEQHEHSSQKPQPKQKRRKQPVASRTLPSQRRTANGTHIIHTETVFDTADELGMKRTEQLADTIGGSTFHDLGWKQKEMSLRVLLSFLNEESCPVTFIFDSSFFTFTMSFVDPKVAQKALRQAVAKDRINEFTRAQAKTQQQRKIQRQRLEQERALKAQQEAENQKRQQQEQLARKKFNDEITSHELAMRYSDEYSKKTPIEIPDDVMKYRFLTALELERDKENRDRFRTQQEKERRDAIRNQEKSRSQQVVSRYKRSVKAPELSPVFAPTQQHGDEGVISLSAKAHGSQRTPINFTTTYFHTASSLGVGVAEIARKKQSDAPDVKPLSSASEFEAEMIEKKEKKLAEEERRLAERWARGAEAKRVQDDHYEAQKLEAILEEEKRRRLNKEKARMMKGNLDELEMLKCPDEREQLTHNFYVPVHTPTTTDLFNGKASVVREAEKEEAFEALLMQGEDKQRKKGEKEERNRREEEKRKKKEAIRQRKEEERRRREEDEELRLFLENEKKRQEEEERQRLQQERDEEEARKRAREEEERAEIRRLLEEKRREEETRKEEERRRDEARRREEERRRDEARLREEEERRMNEERMREEEERKQNEARRKEEERRREMEKRREMERRQEQEEQWRRQEEAQRQAEQDRARRQAEEDQRRRVQEEGEREAERRRKDEQMREQQWREEQEQKRRRADDPKRRRVTWADQIEPSSISDSQSVESFVVPSNLRHSSASNIDGELEAAEVHTIHASSGSLHSSTKSSISSLSIHRQPDQLPSSIESSSAQPPSNSSASFSYSISMPSFIPSNINPSQLSIDVSDTRPNQILVEQSHSDGDAMHGGMETIRESERSSEVDVDEGTLRAMTDLYSQLLRSEQATSWRD